MKTEQYSAERSVSHWRNKEGNKKKFLESNENTTYKNLWETANAMLKGKFIATRTYI
jgi:hypothetical protein